MTPGPATLGRMSAPTLLPTALAPTGLIVSGLLVSGLIVSGEDSAAHTPAAELVEAVRGRPAGRRRPSGELHAVPRTDRTRTALCGARVGGPGRPWGAPRAGTCPECHELVPVPAPSGTPA